MPVPTREQLGAIVRQARTIREWTQAQLAKKAGVTPKAVTDMERGHAYPSAKTLIAVCDALDLDMNAFRNPPPLKSMLPAPAGPGRPRKLPQAP